MKIFIENYVLPCEIGIYEHERNIRQNVRFDVEMESDSANRAAQSGDIEDTVSYDAVITHIRNLANGPHIKLVESLAEDIACFCLGDMRVEKVKVRVSKTDIAPELGGAGVEITRKRGKT